MNRSSAAKVELRVAFIKAQWHADIVNQAHRSFVEELGRLSKGSALVDAFEVPGSFEIPLTAQDVANTGEYAAVVGCGFVVDGGIYRHEFVAQAVLSGLMQVQLDTGVPVLSVVLTPQHFDDSEERRQFFLEHMVLKGKEAANACMAVLRTRSLLVEDLARERARDK